MKFTLETPNGTARYDFSSANWTTTENENDTLIIEADSLEAAITKAGDLVGGIRYRNGSSFEDLNLNTFSLSAWQTNHKA